MSAGTDAAATLLAVAEVFVPGLESDPTPGAPEIAADRFLSHYLEMVMPGLAEGVPSLLDQLAGEAYEGRRFADLSLDQRAAVLDRIRSHELADLRPLPDLLAVLTLAAVYGEWTGQDEEGRLVRRPIGWDLTGFPGPTGGDPTLLREPR